MRLTLTKIIFKHSPYSSSVLFQNNFSLHREGLNFSLATLLLGSKLSDGASVRNHLQKYQNLVSSITQNKIEFIYINTKRQIGSLRNILPALDVDALFLELWENFPSVREFLRCGVSIPSEYSPVENKSCSVILCVCCLYWFHQTWNFWTFKSRKSLYLTCTTCWDNISRDLPGDRYDCLKFR